MPPGSSALVAVKITDGFEKLRATSHRDSKPARTGIIDIDKRDSIPVIEDGKKIVWVVGYRMSEDAKVTSATKKVVKLSAQNI